MKFRKSIISKTIFVLILSFVDLFEVVGGKRTHALHYSRATIALNKFKLLAQKKVKKKKKPKKSPNRIPKPGHMKAMSKIARSSKAKIQTFRRRPKSKLRLQKQSYKIYEEVYNKIQAKLFLAPNSELKIAILRNGNFKLVSYTANLSSFLERKLKIDDEIAKLDELGIRQEKVTQRFFKKRKSQIFFFLRDKKIDFAEEDDGFVRILDGPDSHLVLNNALNYLRYSEGREGRILRKQLADVKRKRSIIAREGEMGYGMLAGLGVGKDGKGRRISGFMANLGIDRDSYLWDGNLALLNKTFR